jgi:hypothetical protein
MIGDNIVWIALGIGSLVLVCINVACLTFCLLRRNQRMEQKKMESGKDENDIYGTYGRGFDGEGDYGDGDQQIVTDANDYYEAF